MTKRSKNYEPPLHIDLDFDEALERFAKTDKCEADKLAEQGKKKSPRAKPPATKGDEPD